MPRRKKSMDQPRKLQAANPSITTVDEYFGPYRNRVEGLKYGLEIEVETANNRFAGCAGSPYWTSVGDGSLRGPDGDAGGREFLFRAPLTFAQSLEALTELDVRFNAANVKNVPSVRTSVHVHVNVQHLTLTQLVNLLCLYYVAEPVLCRYNGAEREHNVFALQVRHAVNIMDELIQAFGERKMPRGPFDLKYAALNVMPLFRSVNDNAFGTVEFRAGRGIVDRPTDCQIWLSMINELVTTAMTFTSPDEVIAALSANGPEGFIREVLPETYRQTRDLFRDGELAETVVDSMRTVQDLAYRIDWGDYKPQHSLKKKDRDGRL